MNRRAFHCPYCSVYAPQGWHHLVYIERGNIFGGAHLQRGQCFNCREVTYWFYGSTISTTEETPTAVMVIPSKGGAAPIHHPDFPEDPAADYEEARSIVERSPRGAAALLRLALQKLCAELGQPGQDINADIGALVAQGLPPGVQQALDSLRVIGNEAVHPGLLDLRDDRDTAVSLFDLLNYIVEKMITQPKELEAIYAKLPENKLKGIEDRDRRTPAPQDPKEPVDPDAG